MATHEAEQKARTDLERKVQDETGKRIETMGQYHEERAEHEECKKARESAESDRATLVRVNQDLAHELRRLRGLFFVVFSSKRAKELAVENRDVHVTHLRELTGGNKFTAKHVALAMGMAQQERERQAVATAEPGVLK